ncbi:pyridoxal-phosphate-dependent aminotransferase family protein, partial [Ruminococcus flavefaciens]|uniref:pyridoxal-phosphate-dependent aminotransferase family protein n=1 Tax=Ruminococcus flavefaciens TaxID=1265 RepID=UPI00035CA766
MLNFTVGPVMSSDEVIEVANHSTPYFRTPEFSQIMLENEKMILDMLHAPEKSRCVFLTTSGTGAMESCVMNILSDKDRVIVINGGSFGHRFVELCEVHGRNFTEVKCEFGRQLRKEQLEGLEDHTALLINMHETSSGVLYDMDLVSDFCKKNNIMLIVDAISAFIADELDMEEMGAAAVLTGSQKALAVQPGISLIALSPAALERVEENKEVCMYLSMKQAL